MNFGSGKRQLPRFTSSLHKNLSGGKDRSFYPITLY